MYQSAPGTFRRYYYLTYGQGRLLAFTDSLGTDAPVTYNQFGGSEAGATVNSHSFASSRAESPDAPQLSFYRNRYYDEESGTWTQEDPIGPAGGVNLYSFAGNNPVTYSDPFGLRVCFKGSDEDVEKLREGAEDATGTRITLDASGCVEGLRGNGNRKYNRIRRAFLTLVNDPDKTYTTQFDRSGQHYFSHYDAPTRTAYIIPSDAGGYNYETGHWWSPCWLMGGSNDTPQTLGGLVAHELIGHGIAGGGTEGAAKFWENQYHAAVGQPLRCGGR
jgi:RHS repeat-associated protein